MAKKIQLRRVLWLALLLATAFAGLGYRLFDLQVLRHEKLSALAEGNTQRQFLREPRRGDILDAKGYPLATTVSTKTVWADPVLLGGRQAEVAAVLAPLLQKDATELTQLLAPVVRQNAKGQAVTNRYVRLKRNVPVEAWEKIQAAMTNFDAGAEKRLSKSSAGLTKREVQKEIKALQSLRRQAIGADDDQLRIYPNQRLAAHVLGFTCTEDKKVDGDSVLEMRGLDGIEATMNSKLAGVPGWRVTEIDKKSHEQVSRREQDVEPTDGYNVVLSIDTVLQNIVEQALADAMEKHSPLSISGVVVRPSTGELLAMATLPNFDPNRPNESVPDARRNRVISDVAEPGSTFKIVVVSGALNEGLVKLTDAFDCEHGHWFYGGRPLHDHEAYGVLSVEQIITKSSNIGAAKIGVQMGEDRLYNYIRSFGFGSPEGLPLPGEVAGIVHPVKNWRKVSLAQIPMGQGIAVTRLQMTMAMAAIANHGCLMRPMLIERLEDRDHRVVARYTPQKVRQVISEATARQMVQALKTVVSPVGTAPKAALEHYTVAGKTGTAQKVENGVYVRKYFASFIGFFPADNPELCISVTLDEPKQGYYGGQVAGPIFKRIAEQAANYLNIRPDIEGPPALPARMAAALDSQKTALSHTP